MKKIDIDHDELYTLYIIENKSQDDIAKVLKCSRSKVACEIKKLGFKKSKDSIHELKVKSYIERYGVESPTACSEIQKKIIDTNLKRYGKQRPTQNNEVLDKVKKTNIIRYGSESPLDNVEIQIKIAETNLKKYGVKNPFQSKEIQEKIKKTNIERYGVSNPSKNFDIKAKKAETNLKNFGVSTPFESNIVREKIKKTNIERYGCENPIKNSLVLARGLETSIKNGNTSIYFGKTVPEWARRYSVPEVMLYKKIKEEPDINKDEFNNFLEEYSRGLTDIENIINIELKLSKWNKLFNRELKYRPDFKITDSIALNVDGLYWHSEKNVGKYYHFDMREKYEDLGFRIFQFRSNEILNFRKLKIIKSMINNTTNSCIKIGARKANIITPTTEQSKDFLERNHLKGYKNARSKALVYNDKIISIMSYIVKGGVLKIERFCSEINYSIMGAFSKLLSNIVNGVDFNFIHYWVDLRYGVGNFLINHGFNKERDVLGWEWTDGNNTYNRLRCRANMDERHLSQSDYASELNWYKIYDSGQRLFQGIRYEHNSNKIRD